MVVVAAPAAILAALFAILFMIAWYYFGQTIIRTLSVNLPLVGNVIGKLVGDSLEATYTFLVYLFDGAIGPLTNAVTSVVNAQVYPVSALTAVAENTYAAVWQLRNVHIPWAGANALNLAQQFASAIGSQAAAALAGAETAINAEINTVLADATNFYNVAIAYTKSAYDSALAYAQSLYWSAVAQITALSATVATDIANAESTAAAFTTQAYDSAVNYASGLAVKGEQDLAAAVSQVEGYAEQTAKAAVGVLVTDIDNAITGSLSGIWSDVDGAVTDVIGVIGVSDPDILSAIKSIDWSIPQDIAGIAALAGTTALTLTRYLKDCGIPNCQNLSQFGNELQQLLNVFEDASFVALLVELIHNPTEAASLVQDTFGSSIAAALDATKALLGV